MPDFVKSKKKGLDDEEEASKKKRPGILDRENVFRKPYEKE